jgi:hypothetical protein
MFLQYQHTRMRFKQKRFVSRDNGRPGTRRKLLLLFRHTGGITRPSALRYSAFCHSGTRRKMLLHFRRTGGITKSPALRSAGFCHSGTRRKMLLHFRRTRHPWR